jgi:opacity protein-like surface antigen
LRENSNSFIKYLENKSEVIMINKKALFTFVAVLSATQISSQAQAIELMFKPYVGLDLTRSHVNIDDTSHTLSDVTTNNGFETIRETETMTNLQDVDLNSVGLRLGADVTDFLGFEGRFGTGISDDKMDSKYNYTQDFSVSNAFDNTSQSDSPVKAKLNHYMAALAKLQTPEYYGFRLHGLSGVSYAQLEFNSQVNNLSKTENATSFAYGLGASYGITEHIRFNTEYLKLNKEVDSMNAGLTYHF